MIKKLTIQDYTIIDNLEIEFEQGSYLIYIEIEDNGIIKKYSMSHYWPVREARPAYEKMPPPYWKRGLRVT